MVKGTDWMDEQKVSRARSQQSVGSAESDPIFDESSTLVLRLPTDNQVD